MPSLQLRARRTFVGPSWREESGAQGAAFSFLLRSVVRLEMDLNVRERLFAFACLALPLAYLLRDHYPPWVAFHADLVTAIALIPLMFWAVWQRGPIPGLTLGAVLLSLVPLIQAGAGQIIFAGDAWMAWLYLMGFALAVLAGARFAPARPRESLACLAPMWTSLVVVALISVGIAIHQALGLNAFAAFIAELTPGSRPYANLSQPNQLATLLMLGLAGTGFLFEAKRLRGAIAMAASLLLAFGVGLTQSRTPLLGLAVIWPAYLLMRRRAALRTTPIALLTVTAAFALTVWSWPSLSRILLLAELPSLMGRMGENLRMTLWQSMGEALVRSPWVGYGWNQVSLAQQATALEFPATRYYFDSAHNVILDIALWSGLPVAVAVVAGLCLWLARRVAACRDPLSWCVLLAVAVVLCHAMVEYPLSYAYFLLPVGFFMGTLNEGADVESTRWTRLRPSRPILGLVGLGVLAIFVRVGVEYMQLEDEWRQIRFQQLRIGDSKAAPPLHTIVLTQLQARARFAQTMPAQGMPPEQLEWMRLVVERYAGAGTIFKYAKALALNGEPEAAGVALAKLCKIQMPGVCRNAVNEWRSDSEERHPEFRNVVLPAMDSP